MQSKCTKNSDMRQITTDMTMDNACGRGSTAELQCPYALRTTRRSVPKLIVHGTLIPHAPWYYDLTQPFCINKKYAPLSAPPTCKTACSLEKIQKPLW